MRFDGKLLHHFIMTKTVLLEGRAIVTWKFYQDSLKLKARHVYELVIVIV